MNGSEILIAISFRKMRLKYDLQNVSGFVKVSACYAKVKDNVLYEKKITAANISIQR